MKRRKIEQATDGCNGHGLPLLGLSRNTLQEYPTIQCVPRRDSSERDEEATEARVKRHRSQGASS